MKRIIHHFLGSTYSEKIHSYLLETYSQFNWKVFNISDEFPTQETLLISPTPDNAANIVLSKLCPSVKKILLLDLNHQFFDDTYRLVNKHKFSLIFSPYCLNKLRTKNIASVSLQMILRNNPSKPSNEKDFIFISQPLIEDKRPELNQFNILRTLLTLTKERNCKIYYMRHPRELSPLPPDLAIEARLENWSKSPELAYSTFKHWAGLNSLPLLCARELGLQTYQYSSGQFYNTSKVI